MRGPLGEEESTAEIKSPNSLLFQYKNQAALLLNLQFPVRLLSEGEIGIPEFLCKAQIQFVEDDDAATKFIDADSELMAPSLEGFVSRT